MSVYCKATASEIVVTQLDEKIVERIRYHHESEGFSVEIEAFFSHG